MTLLVNAILAGSHELAAAPQMAMLSEIPCPLLPAAMGWEDAGSICQGVLAVCAQEVRPLGMNTQSAWSLSHPIDVSWTRPHVAPETAGPLTVCAS